MTSRYSQLYLTQNAPTSDSERARNRLALLLSKVISVNHVDHTQGLNRFFEGELGIRLSAANSSQWRERILKVALRDLLDIVSLTYGYVGTVKGTRVGADWLAECRRIFREEQLAYEIDDNCIVHPAVDIEFQRNRQTTVASLQLPRYANSLSSFERISQELSSSPPDGKEAWRAVFSANEGLFKLMFPSAPQLNTGAIDTHLLPIVQRTFSNDAVALRAANKQVNAFKDWVDSSHNYRHEQGSEEPVQPPLDLAVLAISLGTAFLRWLVTIDQETATRK